MDEAICRSSNNSLINRVMKTSHLNLEMLKNPKKLNLNKNYNLEGSVDNEESRFFNVFDKERAQNHTNTNQAEFDSAAITENIELSKEIDKNITFQSRRKIDNKTNSWVPYNWEIQLNNIKQMRSDFSAPVDKMGCHRCADEFADGPVFRFQTLIALMLSSQTKDQVTFRAMSRLKQINCCAEVITSMPDEELGKLIYPVSFWKRKVHYLKRTAKILLEDYDGDIPKNVEALCTLPGVGPKMAHICMQVAWNKISGIGVDTHVHRIINRLKWVAKPTSNPEETRIALESWLPKEHWSEINHLFVGFGQEICQPRNPKCSSCSNYMICPYAKIKYQF